MFKKSKYLPMDMILECQDRYSPASKIGINECIETYERNGNYTEFLYAIHGFVNQAPYARNLRTILKDGENYIRKSADEENLDGWKNISVNDYIKELKSLSVGDRILEPGKFAADCLCAAWVAKHST